MNETPDTVDESTVQGQNELREKVGKYADWLVIDASGIKLCVIRHIEGPVDPLHCLNACAEFEEMLTVEQRKLYVHWLMRLNGNLPTNHVYPEEIYEIITATAEQRCRAFAWHFMKGRNELAVTNQRTRHHLAGQYASAKRACQALSRAERTECELPRFRKSQFCRETQRKAMTPPVSPNPPL